jgi:hypothetical protein
MRLLPLICICAFIFSCSVKKRSYRKGFYIEWAFSKQTKRSSPSVQLHSPVASDNEKAEEEHVLASTGDNPITAKPQRLVITFDENCGDSIFFRKGSPIKAKVLELNEKQIKYKRCDNFDGPTIVVNKGDVDYIRYGNGMTEKFDAISPAQETYTTQPVKKEIPSSKKKIHPLAVLSLVFTIASVFLGIFLLGAFITIPIAERKIMQNSDKYKGLKLLKICKATCKILSFIYLFLLILLLSKH